MFRYPWGDFHSLNLGWFLLQFKDWVEKIQEYLDNGGGTAENLANVIAPVFNAGNTYLTGDYVLYNDELYKALEPVPAGTWNPYAWERCLVTEEMGSGSGGVDNVARLMIAGQYSNTYNYQKYAICRYADKLWMCNTNLPSGGEEWEPSHWDEITVGAGLTGLRRSADALSNAIVDIQNIVGDGSLSGFSATNLTGAANELKGSLISVQGDIDAYKKYYKIGQQNWRAYATVKDAFDATESTLFPSNGYYIVPCILAVGYNCIAYINKYNTDIQIEEHKLGSLPTYAFKSGGTWYDQAPSNTIHAKSFNDNSETTTRTIAIPSNTRFLLAIASSSTTFCGLYMGISYSGGATYITPILNSTGITFDTTVNYRLTINTTDSRSMTFAVWSLSGHNANNYYIV